MYRVDTTVRAAIPKRYASAVIKRVGRVRETKLRRVLAIETAAWYLFTDGTFKKINVRLFKGSGHLSGFVPLPDLRWALVAVLNPPGDGDLVMMNANRHHNDNPFVQIFKIWSPGKAAGGK
jgi:hypothetical protein